MPEGEPKEDADVNSVTHEELKRNGPVKRFRCSEVHDKKNVGQDEEPARGVASGTVHDVVGNTLDILPLSFTRILVLFVGFALPGSNVKVVENDVDVFAGLVSGTVGKETIGGSTIMNIALQRVGKFRFGLHFIGVANMSASAKEYLSTGFTAVDGRDIRINTIR
jgi:hypothetical protein